MRYASTYVYEIKKANLHLLLRLVFIEFFFINIIVNLHFCIKTKVYNQRCKANKLLYVSTAYYANNTNFKIILVKNCVKGSVSKYFGFYQSYRAIEQKYIRKVIT